MFVLDGENMDEIYHLYTHSFGRYDSSIVKTKIMVRLFGFFRKYKEA